MIELTCVAHLFKFHPQDLLLQNSIKDGKTKSAWLCRNSWEYKLARRLILSIAAVAAIGAASILVACDFDDARAAAVLTSIPRTVNSAGKATDTLFRA